MTPAERVASGADWLDRYYYGWRDNVDLSTLNVADPLRCVLAQMASGIAPYNPAGGQRFPGSYYNVVRSKFRPEPPWICLRMLTVAEAAAMGFTVLSGWTFRAEIAELQELWVTELGGSRGGRDSSGVVSR